jgi:hypothetical protein
MENYSEEIFELLSQQERKEKIVEIREKFSNPKYKVRIGSRTISNREELIDWQIANKYI